MKPSARVRCALAVVLISLAGAAAVHADEPPPPTVAAFVKSFLDGAYEPLVPAMSDEMKAQFTADQVKVTRDQLAAIYGDPKEVRSPWLEVESGPYRRFRVPVDFTGAAIDLMVVLDPAGKVAGFFVGERKPPPAPAKEGGPASTSRADVAGRWEGTVEVPGSPALGIVVQLDPAEGTWSGTADIPMQGAKGIRLESIRVEGDAVTFALAGVPGNPVFEGRLADGKIRGKLRQSGMEFPFSLGREATAPPRRPQEPQGPFPYSEEEARFDSGSLVRAGTLTLPDGDGPFPAVLLLSGSGAQNRDEELFGHRPFRVLADRLARAGVAVLRLDDRGVGGSTGSLASSTIEDLAAEALDGVRWLRGRARIDPARVGVVGHSEGGIVAPVAAARSADVAFIVLLAGPGKRGDEVLVRQNEVLFAAAGTPPERLAPVRREHRKFLDLVASNAPADRLREQARALVRVQLRAAGQEAPASTDVESAVTASMALVSSSWFRSFLTHDPRPSLRRVKVPVLALWGGLDLQVDAVANEAAVRRALRAAKNPDVTLRIVPGLNHLFQKAKTGTVEEYGAIEETMSPEVLDTVAAWIAARAKRQPTNVARPSAGSRPDRRRMSSKIAFWNSTDSSRGGGPSIGEPGKTRGSP